MEKKEYIEPEMNIIDLSIEGVLLDASFEDEFGSIKKPTDIASV